MQRNGLTLQLPEPVFENRLLGFTFTVGGCFWGILVFLIVQPDRLADPTLYDVFLYIAPSLIVLGLVFLWNSKKAQDKLLSETDKAILSDFVAEAPTALAFVQTNKVVEMTYASYEDIRQKIVALVIRDKVERISVSP